MAGNLTYAMLLSVVDKATAPLRAVGKAFAAVSQAGESLGRLSQSMHDARENVQDFADRGRAALESLVAPAASIEQALLELGPVAALAGGDASKALQTVRAAAEEYSAAHSANAAEYITVATQMTRVTQDQASALEATAVALRLASATTTEAKGATNTLNVLYQAAGDKTADFGSELGRLADVLTRTKQVYGDAFQVGELADPLKDAAGAARDAKVPVEQLVGALGAFGAAGILGGEGGMAVSNVITGLQAAAQPLGIELVKTSKGGLDLAGSLQAVVAKYGDIRNASPQVLAALQQAFGPAWRDVSTLLGQTDKLSQQWGSIGASAGAAAAGQAAAEATMTGQLAKLDNQLSTVKATLGTGVMNAVAALAPEILKIVTPMAEFVAANPKLAAIAGTVAVLTVGTANLVAPVLSVSSAIVGFAASALGATGGIGAITTACWAWAASLLANPITWIVAAVIAAVALLYIYWKPITAFFIKIWAKIKEAFSGAWNSVVAMWGKVSAWFSGLFGGIRDAFKRSFIEGLWKVFCALSPLAWLVKLWAAMLQWMTGLWLKMGEAVWNGLVSVGSAITSIFSGIWQSIKDAFGQGILQGLARLFEMFSPVAWLMKWWNAVTQYLFGLSLAELGSKILNSLLNGFLAMGGAISGFFMNLGATLLSTLGSIGSTLWSGISSDLQQVWDLLSSFSLVEAGANIVNTIVEGIKSAASAPAEAMADVVAAVRAYLPFSPAKVGPLRDLNKVKLVETVASAVHPEPLVDAMRGVATQAMGAVSSVPAGVTPMVPAGAAAGYEAAASTQSNAGAGGYSSAGFDLSAAIGAVSTVAAQAWDTVNSVVASVPAPTVAPIPASAGPGAVSTSNSSTMQMSVTIELGGGAGGGAVEQLEAWIRDPSNARALAGAVESHAKRKARKELT